MGTNYYFQLKNVNVDISLPKCCDILEQRIREEVDRAITQISEIHIGKRSTGWKPLFQRTEYYSSLEELKDFYISNRNCLSIKDEYDEELTYDELQEQLFKWNKDNPSGLKHEDIQYFYLDKDGYYFSKGDFE